MDLLALALSLSLPMSGGQFTGDYSIDISPVIGVDVSLGQWEKFAVALPGVVFRDPEELAKVDRHGETTAEAYRHELMHVEQQQALGPAFWLAYALTGGQAFEPHRTTTTYFEEVATPDTGLPIPTPPMYAMRHRIDNDYSQMWMPDDTTRGSYPLFRMAREGGGTRLQFMPGYPELLRLGNE
jgi:hypothetical protein